MDIEEQAGTKGLQYAVGKGLAVVIMEPIRGGQLAGTVPDPVQALWDMAATKHKPADWALQWVWNQPEVSVVLSGMSTFEQAVEKVEIANCSSSTALASRAFDRSENTRLSTAHIQYP
jgi:predicted aldo/keto reductase-like oxidoreductase